MRATIPVVLSLVVVALAGCADEPAKEDDPFKVDKLKVDGRTGGIRGVVVDPSITPVADVTIRLSGGGETTTGADGVFTFTGLEPGTYFVTAEKLLYEGVQSSVQVVAGVEDPPVLTLRITRLTGVTPFVETHQFDGFYDCAFALTFITDSCDFVLRTVHDYGVEPVPRGIQNNVNTGFLTVSPQVQTIIQEGFYDNSVTSTFWTMVSSTPIDNGCDCSDVDFIDDIGDDGTTYARGDRGDGAFPAADGEEEVAVRGFLPFQEATEADYALSLEFQIFTTLFYNFQAADGWTLETRDQHPVPR